ncbi:MAG: hypothetical protein ABI204_05210 [Ginsengibacter sp.]
MLVQNFSKAIVMADFYINQADITREFCENKDKPKLKCNGHCQLKKELEKKDSKEVPEILKEIKLYVNSERFVLPTITFPGERTRIRVINDNRVSTISFPIFHPPS